MKKKKPPEKKEHIASIQTGQFQGPIPPPWLLTEYENISAGIADRIIKMAESEASHRHEMEKQSLKANIEGARNEARDTKRGQIFGLIIGVTAIVCGTIAAVNGAQIAGGFIGAGGVAGLVSAFIIERRRDTP